MQQYYDFIKQYTNLLNKLEYTINQRKISRNRALNNLETYKNEIEDEKNNFVLIYMRDITSILSDNYNEVKEIDGMFFRLINRCDNLEYVARGLD